MKKVLKKHKKAFIILIAIVVVVGGAVGINFYKDSHLSFGVYRNCKNGICEYIMFDKSGKVYMIEQNIKSADTSKEIDNYDNLVMKYGVDNIVKKCNGYGYCNETLHITEKFSGIYSLNDGRIKVEWDFDSRDLDYYKIKDGKLNMLDMNLETILTSYYPAENYNKWKKCRKNNDCDEVFSIEDPLSDFDYDAVYKNFESNSKSQDCKHSKEYAFKDVTGDGIDEILIRRSVDGEEWRLEQIYYINTWQDSILPLGDDLPYNYTEISDVYEGGYIYLSGNGLDGSYYKTSNDGYIVDYYAGSKYDLSSRKSLYEEIDDWKSYPIDETYCQNR